MCNDPISRWAAIMPLDYSRAGIHASPNVVHRTEYSLLIQSINWHDLEGLFINPAGWFREVAIKWKQTSFEVRKPVTLIVQHLSKTYNGAFSAFSLANAIKPGSIVLEEFQGALSEQPYSQLLWFANLIKKVGAEFPQGYFQAELALDTNTVIVSYLQPTCIPDAKTFPKVKITKATVVSVNPPPALQNSARVPGLLTGRAHFDIGVDTHHLAKTRGRLIKEYIESCKGFCDLINNLADEDFLQTTAEAFGEGDHLQVGPAAIHGPKKFAHFADPSNGHSSAYLATVMSTPTVVAQGMSETSGCYICVDTSILDDGTTYYPTDVLYKLYCD